MSSDGPRVPLEFAAAAYRYGHAQIRRRYRVNAQFGPVPVFPDLMGFGPVRPEHAVDWSLLIGTSAQKAKRIDVRLPRALIELPAEISGVRPDDEYSSLAARDLARGRIVGLASGEAIAREMGITPLGARAIGLAALGWRYETPLWLYVLREAELLCDGERLGPVGGRIVGEVLVGIVDYDQDSFRALEPDWQPSLAEDGGLTFAEVLLPTSGVRISTSSTHAHPSTPRDDARISVSADGTKLVGAGQRARVESKRLAASPSFTPACPVAHGSIAQDSTAQ